MARQQTQELYLIRFRVVGVTDAVGEDESDSCGDVVPMAMREAGVAPSGAEMSLLISSLLHRDTAVGARRHRLPSDRGALAKTQCTNFPGERDTHSVGSGVQHTFCTEQEASLSSLPPTMQSRHKARPRD